MDRPVTVSIVAPVYGVEKYISRFAESVLNQTYPHIQFVFVNDGSKDNTYKELKSLFTAHPDKVSVVNLSRNFGKEAAILAGLKRASGDYVSLVDADLQQRPEIVVDMVNYLEEHEEYDVVAAYQEHRIEGKLMPGQKVVVVEDLISTGGSCIDVVEALREAGAEVLGVVSIFTYGMEKGLKRLAAANVKNVSLTNFDVIAEVAAAEGYIAQSDVARLLKFRNNPDDESWMEAKE